MRSTTILAVALAGLLLPQPLLAAEKAAKAQKLPKAHAAFIAKYNQLLKKYPKAQQHFLLTYQSSAKRRFNDDFCPPPFCRYTRYRPYCHCEHPQ
jgi:hypothetical protein